MKIQLRNGFFTKISFLFFNLITLMFSDFNIAPYCKIKSFPYGGFSLSSLVDGIYDIKENEQLINTPQFNTMCNSLINLGVEIHFLLPEVKELKKIRIFKNIPEVNYILFINNQKVKMIESQKIGWVEFIPENKIKCEEIKIKAIGGYQPVYLGIEEIEIIVEGEKGNSFLGFNPIKEKKRYNIEKDIFLKEDNIKRSLYVLGPFVYDSPEIWAEKIKELGVNTIILYSHFYGTIEEYEKGKYTLPEDPTIRRYLQRGINLLKEQGKNTLTIASWPSKVVPGTKENYLKKTIDAFHKFNIKVIVSSGFYIPFDTVGHYPRCGQSDWHLFPQTHCIISDKFISNFGSSLYKEIIENQADGVVLGGDEFGAEGHRLSAISPYDPCIKEFKKKYGYRYEDLPIDAQDSLIYRKWEIFEYEGIAKIFKEWTKTIKSLKKDVIATCLLLSWPLIYSDRMWSGLAYDIIGYISGMDYLTTDYYRPLTTIKLLIGANPKRKAGYTWTIGYFQPKYTPFKNEIYIYGPLLGIIGQSGEEIAEISLYEHRHIFSSKKGEPIVDSERENGYNTVKKFFNYVKYLQKQGIDKSQTPKEVLLLYSRSSEDWWQLKHNYKQAFSPTIMKNKLGPDWRKLLLLKTTDAINQNYLKQLEGYIYHQAIMDLFTSRGIPYDIYFIDQKLPCLEKYKIIILPFGYSINKNQAEIIKKAVRKGVHLILINFKGEVDEFGQPYKIPLFEEIMDKENVYFLEFDINKKSEEEIAQQILPIIFRYTEIPKFEILNQENLYGKIFCFTLKNQNKYFLTIINFSKTIGYLNIDFPKQIKNIKGITIDEIIEYDFKDKRNIQIEIPKESSIVLICDIENK